MGTAAKQGWHGCGKREWDEIIRERAAARNAQRLANRTSPQTTLRPKTSLYPLVCNSDETCHPSNAISTKEQTAESHLVELCDDGMTTQKGVS